MVKIPAGQTVDVVFIQCQNGQRGKFQEVTEAQWSSCYSHVCMVIQVVKPDATLDEVQAYVLIRTVMDICLNNPVDAFHSSFRGTELVQLVTFVNTAQ